MKADHLRLVRDSEYLELLADRVSALPPGQSSHLTVIHEADDSCCLKEPWPLSLHRLLTAAGERRQLASIVVALADRPDGAAGSGGRPTHRGPGAEPHASAGSVGRDGRG